MTDQTLTILFHEIINDPSMSGFNNKSSMAYKHKVGQFEAYLNKIKLIEKSDAGYSQSNQKMELRISFDDGGVSNIEAARTLTNAGLKAIFFISTSFIGKKGFLTKSQILEILELGHEIGSHSHTHPNVFRKLSRKEMLSEWEISKKLLEEITNKEILECSVPGGDVSPLVYRTAFESGYKTLYDSEPELYLRKYEDLNIYGRFCLKTSHSDVLLENWLRGDELTNYQRNWRIKKNVKKIVYPIYKLKRKIDEKRR